MFGRDHVHIIIYDDFSRDPLSECRKAFEFLGVDPGFEPQLDRHNPSKAVNSLFIAWMVNKQPWFYRMIPRFIRDPLDWRLRKRNVKVAKRDKMKPELRQRLTAQFVEEIKALSELIGRDLTHWSDAAKPASSVSPAAAPALSESR